MSSRASRRSRRRNDTIAGVASSSGGRAGSAAAAPGHSEALTATEELIHRAASVFEETRACALPTTPGTAGCDRGESQPAGTTLSSRRASKKRKPVAGWPPIGPLRAPELPGPPPAAPERSAPQTPQEGTAPRDPRLRLHPSKKRAPSERTPDRGRGG